MALPAGWRDILRAIRDGYRHFFPSPDTEPSAEERERQRASDRLRGFAYFDTFDQLEAWEISESDSIQRANTPLLPRPRDAVEHDQKTTIKICHDYAGNYHTYEAIQGTGVEREDYVCEYLQYVDSFIYFSHKLACVPPPSWTNALHRNGVKALGTVLIEPQTQGSKRLLHHRVSATINEHVHFPLAKKLAAIAEHYGFDGWLVNIEKPFTKEQWNATLLEQFLRQLRQDLGSEKELVWYDAITSKNNIKYQNALTVENLLFSEACGSLLTNYCWTDAKLQSSKQLAVQQGFKLDKIYFGIDVWAQNTTKLTHPRVTYPAKGGGGTNTGVAVAKLAQEEFSAAFFGPAWTYEHFSGARGRQMDQVMWDGQALPDEVDCSCEETRQTHPPNLEQPIIRWATKYVVGSDRFFYTDFSSAFGYHDAEAGDKLYNHKRLHSQLGSQAIIPTPRQGSNTEERAPSRMNTLQMRLERLIDQTQLVVEVWNRSSIKLDAADSFSARLAIFDFNMLADGTLCLHVGYRHLSPGPETETNFFLKYSHRTTYHALEKLQGEQTLQVTIGHSDCSEEFGRLLAIGIHFKARRLPDQKHLRLVEIAGIRIIPNICLESPMTCRITNIRLECREILGQTHWRLCWDFYSDTELFLKHAGQPYSQITGPFSHFLIGIRHIKATAYGLEWVVSSSLVDVFAAGGAEVKLVGVGFDGRHLAELKEHLRIPET